MTTQTPPGSENLNLRENSRKRLRQNIAIGVGLFLLCAGGVYVFLRSQAKKEAAEIAEANRPLPEQVQVAALGRVEPQGGVIEVAASESGVVSELLVEPGDFVTQGQVLGYLDLYGVRQAERNFAQSQLAEARETLMAQVQLGEAQIQEANTRMAQVDRPQEESLRAQAATIRDLEAQLNLARIDLNRFESLAQQGAIAQQQLDSKRAEVTQLNQKIAAAAATFAQLSAARSANIENASAQMQAAQANLTLSQATAGVQSAERNLALAEARLERAVLRSPISGQVIEVFVEPGESNSGGAGSQPILSVGNTQVMQVVAEVYETDVGLVDVGQSATIRSRNGAFDEVLGGTVEEIALQIFKNDVLDDDPAANADARVVEVDIVIDQPEVIRGLTNLQVDVVIDVDEEV